MRHKSPPAEISLNSSRLDGRAEQFSVDSLRRTRPSLSLQLFCQHTFGFDCTLPSAGINEFSHRQPPPLRAIDKPTSHLSPFHWHSAAPPPEPPTGVSSPSPVEASASAASAACCLICPLHQSPPPPPSGPPRSCPGQTATSGSVLPRLDTARHFGSRPARPVIKP